MRKKKYLIKMVQDSFVSISMYEDARPTDLKITSKCATVALSLNII